MRIFFFLLIFIFAAIPGVRADVDSKRELLKDAVFVLEEILETPDFSIPTDLLSKSKAIIIFPTMVKGGFIFAARYGKGVASARDQETGQWSAPSFVETVGGSFGFQAGAEAIDLVLLVMNQRGIGAWLKNQFTLGGEVGVAAGPVGRHAEASADFKMKAEILSYSRSKGVFAGVSVKGTVITTDEDSNHLYYKQKVTPEDILLMGKIKNPPESAKRFMIRLNKLAPPENSKKSSERPTSKKIQDVKETATDN